MVPPASQRASSTPDFRHTAAATLPVACDAPNRTKSPSQNGELRHYYKELVLSWMKVSMDG